MRNRGYRCARVGGRVAGSSAQAAQGLGAISELCTQ